MTTFFEFIKNIFSLLGGIVSLWTLYLWLRPLQKISWRRVEKGIRHLKEELIRDHYHPSLIVGIGRGGAVVSALLSGTMGNIPIIVIDRVYNWTDKRREEGLCEEIKISNNIDRVLLVAGELHSGNTAETYVNYFENMGATEIKMLTFMKEPYPTFSPDYCYLVTDNSNIRLPWMIDKHYKRDSKIAYKK